MNKVLVVAAHPDDEVLGCGGTLIKHTKCGDHVHVMILAEGLTSRDDMRNIEKHSLNLNKLHMASNEVGRIIGAKSVEICNFPDNRMDSVDLLDVVKKVESAVYKYTPNIVYTHHSGDVNIDHQITHRAVITACRPIPLSCVKTILFFETLSSTEWQMPTNNEIFKPNWFINVEGVFHKKMEALKCYDLEMRQYPHSRSYESVSILARYRGISVGCELAEAFSLGRKIE